MGTDRSPDLTTEDEVTYCARHPNVETGLRCGTCGTAICPRCLVQTPVGAKCPDCARMRTLPMFDVTPLYIARGVAAAWLTGAATGAAWGFLLGGRGFFGFLLIFVGMGIGYVIAEGISFATNRKRGVELQLCAVMGAVVAYFVRNAVVGLPLLVQGDLWGFIAAGVAAYYAWRRLGNL